MHHIPVDDSIRASVWINYADRMQKSTPGIGTPILPSQSFAAEIPSMFDRWIPCFPQAEEIVTLLDGSETPSSSKRLPILEWIYREYLDTPGSLAPS